MPELKKKSTLLATFLLSISVLMFEVVLVRLLSVVLFSNFAFLSISIALFGLAVGGLIVYGFPNFFSATVRPLRLAQCSLAYAALLTSFPLVFFRHDFSLPAHMLAVVLLIAFAALPFILANICLSVLFMAWQESAGTLYFADLTGAGIGVVLTTVLMSVISAPSVLVAAAVIGFLAAAAFNGRSSRAVALVAAIALVGFITQNEQSHVLDIVYNKGGREQNIVFSKWNTFSRISLEDEQHPGRMASYPDMTDAAAPRMGIRIDADAYTPVMKFNGDPKTVDFLSRDLSAAAYAVSHGSKSLVIGPGGGRDVLIALSHGFHVRGVDINGIIVGDLMKGRLRSYTSGLYLRPDVDVIVAEGRSYLMKDTGTYDVINLPLVDTWASTSAGSLFLVENHLYTVEAFEDYLRHLTPDGILTISRWNTDGLRLLSLFLEASKNLGIAHPEDNIAVVGFDSPGSSHLDNYLFKLQPFTDQERAAITTFADKNGFMTMYVPGKASASPQAAFLAAPDKQAFAASIGKNLTAVHDDNPFFFFATPLAIALTPQGAKLDGGLALVFYLVLYLSLACVLLPLLTKRRHGVVRASLPTAAASIGYFGTLGLAFMAIELSLIQKCILYLEQPIYSYSVVLAAMLISAGIGSMTVERLLRSKRSVLLAAVAAAAATVLCVPILGALTAHTLAWPIAWKICVSALLVAVPAFPMGMLLPAGMRRLSEGRLTHLVPWCWAVNGGASVLATVLVIIAGMLSGFTSVLFAGAYLYLLAGLLSLKLPEAPPRI